MRIFHGVTAIRTSATLATLAAVILVSGLTVFHAEALPPVIDLDTTNADLTVWGDDADDASGNSVAAGDIDGDTIDDLIIGAAIGRSARGQPGG